MNLGLRDAVFLGKALSKHLGALESDDRSRGSRASRDRKPSYGRYLR